MSELTFAATRLGIFPFVSAIGGAATDPAPHGTPPPSFALPASTAPLSQSVTVLTVLAADLSKSATDLPNSVADLSKSVADLTKSEAELLNSVTELSKSEADLGKSVTELSNSVVQLGKSATNFSKSDTDLTVFLMKLVNSKAELTDSQRGSDAAILALSFPFEEFMKKTTAQTQTAAMVGRSVL